MPKTLKDIDALFDARKIREAGELAGKLKGSEKAKAIAKYPALFPAAADAGIGEGPELRPVAHS